MGSKPEPAVQAAAADTQVVSSPGDKRLNPPRSKTRSSHSLAQTGKNVREEHRSETHPRHQHTQKNANDRATSTTTPAQILHKTQRVKGLQLHTSSTLLGLVFYTLLFSTLTYPASPPKSYPNYVKHLHLPPPPQDEHSTLNPPLATTTQSWNSWCCQDPNSHEWMQEGSLRARPPQHAQHTTKHESKPPQSIKGTSKPYSLKP